jgi:putative copper export protein
MNPQIILPVILSTLHNLFTAVWIGGMIALAFASLPALKQTITDGKTRKQTSRVLQKRLQTLAIISMVGLAATGMLMTRLSPAVSGLFNFGSPYANALSIKHLLMILMVAVAITRSTVNARLMEQPAQSLEKASFLLLIVNIGFGVTVLALSSFLAEAVTLPL